MVQPSTLSALSARLEYTFKDPALLSEALTHRSVGATNNERLEFLGDGVLNFVIADKLFRMYPQMREGDLSRLRASLVNRDSLADISRELDLGAYIKLGAGELKSGGHRRASILADALESILGAVYCDSGFEVCQNLILRLYSHKLNNLPDVQSLKDAKTRLQELLQSRQQGLPEYSVLEVSGKAHAQEFLIECKIQTLNVATQGKGKSRRKAEQVAAELAFEQLQKS